MGFETLNRSTRRESLTVQGSPYDIHPSFSVNAGKAGSPAFEVASVKPADTAVYGRQGIDFRVLPGGRLHATSVTLQQLILQTYALKHYQLAAVPGGFHPNGSISMQSRRASRARRR